jgi:hypothetical protein
MPGTAIAGTVLVAGLTSSPERSYGLAMIVLAAFGVVGLVAARLPYSASQQVNGEPPRGVEPRTYALRELILAATSHLPATLFTPSATVTSRTPNGRREFAPRLMSRGADVDLAPRFLETRGFAMEQLRVAGEA